MSLEGHCQKIDSIYFNLYTDSLKKGTFNYINVDGKYSDGKYLPLTTGQLIFTASAGRFEGNSLYIDSSVREEKVTVRAALIKNPSTWKEMVIYIKKYDIPEKLKTMDEVLDKNPADNNSRRKKKPRLRA